MIRIEAGRDLAKVHQEKLRDWQTDQIKLGGKGTIVPNPGERAIRRVQTAPYINNTTSVKKASQRHRAVIWRVRSIRSRPIHTPIRTVLKSPYKRVGGNGLTTSNTLSEKMPPCRVPVRSVEAHDIERHTGQRKGAVDNTNLIVTERSR